MKKVLKKIQSLFYEEQVPCKIMDGLTFISIPVNYPSVIINNSVERPAQVKIWNVAVKTIEPNFIPRSHAEWMLDIQFQHAMTSLLIGEMEHCEILLDCRHYAMNVPIRRPLEIKNT